VELTGKNYTRKDWRSFLATRRGTVLVAGVCAIVAAGILIFAMQRYRHNINSEGASQTVFVASGAIQKGTAGDAIASQHLFKSTSISGKQVTAGAIADASQLHGKVAAADIYPGQQLTASDFIVGGGLPAQLAPDQRAMAITVDSAHGMVGQIHDGDHVDVYAGFDLEPPTGRNRPVLRLLMGNIPVLKAGASSGSGGLGGGSNPQTQQTNVTLNVKDDQAGPLAFASDNGKVWLVLRPPNTTSTAPPSIISVESLLLGTKPLTSGGQ
jgi:Flp pilus assembly protein CpaB